MIIQASMNYVPTRIIASTEEVISAHAPVPVAAKEEFDAITPLFEALDGPIRTLGGGCLVIDGPYEFMHILGDMMSVESCSLSLLRWLAHKVNAPHVLVNFLSICVLHDLNLNKMVSRGHTTSYTSPNRLCYSQQDEYVSLIGNDT